MVIGQDVTEHRAAEDAPSAGPHRAERVDFQAVADGIDVVHLRRARLAVAARVEVAAAGEQQPVGLFDDGEGAFVRGVGSDRGQHDRESARVRDRVDVTAVHGVAVLRLAADDDRDDRCMGPDRGHQNASRYCSRSQSVTCAWYASHSLRFIPL